MLVAGLVRSGLIDYPGKVAAVVFTQGCNFRCGFCHNPDLIGLEPPASSLQMTETELLEFLEKRAGILDGVVVTGGEPTVQPDLLDFIRKVKALGYVVKLDTNGSNPVVLQTAFNEKLLDYIAMDIKGPAEKYSKICGYTNTKVIQKSIDMIMASGVDYEFRTTVLPHFHSLSDMKQIGEMISGAKKYTIQGFRPQITLDKELEKERSFTEIELKELANEIAPYVEKVVIHDNI